MSKALIIVDVQNDFVTGSLAVPGGEQAATAIHNLLVADFHKVEADAEARYDVVYTTQDWHIDPGDHWSDNPDFVDSWPVHCAAGTWGARFHPEIADLANDDGYIDGFFLKGQYEAAYSGFEANDGRNSLDEALTQDGIDEIHVCGLATDYCVLQTCLDGVRHGYTVRFLNQLSAGITPESTDAAIEKMRAAGVHIVA